MQAWPKSIDAITLFVEDLGEAKTFYGQVFGASPMFEDDNSAAYDFGGTVINLLAVRAAPELIQPAAVADPAGGVRFQLSLEVDDVDAMCDQLRAAGVTLLNGPMDRPWGLRTASFRDPGGHIWEIGHPLT